MARVGPGIRGGGQAEVQVAVGGGVIDVGLDAEIGAASSAMCTSISFFFLSGQSYQ